MLVPQLIKFSLRVGVLGTSISILAERCYHQYQTGHSTHFSYHFPTEIYGELIAFKVF